MQVDDHAVMEMVRRHLSPQDGNDYRVYYDKEIKNSGEPVRIGLREVPMPCRGMRVFVDLMPGANWGHRVAYLLVSEDLAHCIRYDEQFPPFGADVPDEWRSVTA
jgi:hypothetical protein